MQLRSDYMVRATALDGKVRAFAIDSTATVGELRRRHDTDPAVTAALGRLATGTLLFGAMLKEEDQLVTVRVQGNGPAGTLLASANGNGEVRGLVSNPRPDVEQVNAKGKLNVSGVVGTEGRLTVTRDLGMRQPHTSTVELISGEVGEDLAHFLMTSEQTPSAVGIGVFVQPTGDVEAAGGYIVQLMPGIPESLASEIESVIRDLPHPTTMLRDGDSPEQMLTRIFDRDLHILEHRPVRFHCPCSRERAERAILLLGAEEIRKIMAADADKGVTEVICQFCTSVYTIKMPELEGLLSLLN
jgi:molecular chaperone Hsp33